MTHVFMNYCFEGCDADHVIDPGLSLLVTRASLDELARALIHRLPEATAAQLDLIHELERATTGRCRELEVLSLSKNKLMGEVPVALANCVALSHLYLNNNAELSRDVPEEIRWRLKVLKI